MRRINYTKIIVLSSIFLFFLLVGFLFPYTNDDWAWGSSIGLERLNTLFKNYNGRYLGNLLVLVLTRNRILRAFVIASLLTLIINFIGNIVNKQRLTILLMVSLLVVLLPQSLFSQTIAWTSGFANYVPPILLTIIWIYLTKNLLEDKKINISNWFILPIFILGISSCLFMEHVTIYIICLSIISSCYCLIKKIKINANQISFFIGNIIGTFVMFQNEAYYNILKGSDFYRNVPKEGFIIQSVRNYFYSIYDNLIMNNTLVLLIINICLIFLFYKFIHKNCKIKHIKLALSSLVIITFYSIYSIISEFFPNHELFELLFKFIEGILTIIYFFALIILISFLQNKDLKKKLYFFLGSIVFMTAPLFVINPITPRCFYPMYIFWIIFAILLVDECFNYMKLDCFYSLLNFLLSSTILIAMFYILSIFFSVYYITDKMIDHIEIEKQNNSKKIILPKIIYEDYMKHPNPNIAENKRRFKLYYKINENVEIEIVDYQTWYNIFENRR